MPSETPVYNAQEVFDTKYVTSTEILQELNIPRATLMNARRRGLLPQPIVVNGGQLFMWERELIKENLSAWKLMLQHRRGG
jgi:hypothetical protein